MPLSRNLKKILLASSAVLMLTSVGAGTSNLTASAKRRYRPHIARRYRVRHYRHRANHRYYRHAVRRHHAHKKSHSTKVGRHKANRGPGYSKADDAWAKKFNRNLNNLMKKRLEREKTEDRVENKQNNPKYNNNYNIQQSKDAVKQINGYRTERGLRPYYEDKELDNIAMLRAKNIAEGKEAVSHYDKKNHEWYTGEDAYKLGYIKSPKMSCFGENLAKGYNSAKEANNDFMYHDAPSWGHRANIIDKNYGNPEYVGAGYYDGTLVEDFTFYPTNQLNQNY